MKTHTAERTHTLTNMLVYIEKLKPRVAANSKVLPFKN